MLIHPDKAGAIDKFTSLKDVPTSYAGQSGKAVIVNVGETGLDFAPYVGSDEKVKVGAAGTADFLSASYFTQSLLDHIRPTNALFTPSVPSDWSPAPTTANGALDQLAARKIAISFVTVGTAGADYNNFDAAIDSFGGKGGVIHVITNMTVNCAADKDISKITFIGIGAGAGRPQLSPGTITGKWHGSDFAFDSLSFMWLMAGTHLIELRNDFDFCAFRNESIILTAVQALIDATTHEAHINFQRSATTAAFIANESKVCLRLLDGSNVTCGSIDLVGYDAGSTFTGTAATTNVIDEAGKVAYDNSGSGLVATDVQAAIDEIKPVAFSALQKVEDDPTPKLGGALDVDGLNLNEVHDMVSKGGINVKGILPFEAYTTPGTPVLQWNGAGMSDTGQYQLVTVLNGQLRQSGDYGVTWAAREASRSWRGCAVSGDGQYQFAVVYGSTTVPGYVYRSTNYGVTWSAAYSTNKRWLNVATSQNGQYVTAVSFHTTLGGMYGRVAVSSDYGATWGTIAALDNLSIGAIAISATGQYQVLGDTTGNLRVSSDYGATWTIVKSISPYYAYNTAISADGRIMVACGAGSDHLASIWISFDYGVTWDALPGTANEWLGIDISSDGQYITAWRTYGSAPYVYVSNDFGQHWTVVLSGATSSGFTAGAMNADGKYRLVCSFVSGTQSRLYLSSNFEDPSFSIDGQYIFPFNDGTAGQALITDGTGTPDWGGADELVYDNSGSGLTATNVNAAIDEVNAKISRLLELQAGPISFDYAGVGITGETKLFQNAPGGSDVDGIRNLVGSLAYDSTSGTDPCRIGCAFSLPSSIAWSGKSFVFRVIYTLTGTSAVDGADLSMTVFQYKPGDAVDTPTAQATSALVTSDANIGTERSASLTISGAHNDVSSLRFKITRTDTDESNLFVKVTCVCLSCVV